MLAENGAGVMPEPEPGGQPTQLGLAVSAGIMAEAKRQEKTLMREAKNRKPRERPSKRRPGKSESCTGY